jgi:Transglycosylase SLT domain
MSTLRRISSALLGAQRAVFQSVVVFVADVGRGMLVVSHNTLALVGLISVSVVLFTASSDELRHQAELQFLSWLQARQEARVEPVQLAAWIDETPQIDAVSRATASDPNELNQQQALVAHWLARRYRVAPEPISRLVQEAWVVGQRAALDPTLILAIMAIESSFNPFAQSSVGAQGLMQVMTKVHDDKYERFGGTLAAFDPVTNLRVGVAVLKECIARAGSLEAGLRFYVGAANLVDDGGYVGKVLAEQSSLRLVMSGKQVPFLNAAATPSPAPTLVAQRGPAAYTPLPSMAAPESEAAAAEPQLN